MNNTTVSLGSINAVRLFAIVENLKSCTFFGPYVAREVFTLLHTEAKGDKREGYKLEFVAQAFDKLCDWNDAGVIDPKYRLQAAHVYFQVIDLIARSCMFRQAANEVNALFLTELDGMDRESDDYMFLRMMCSVLAGEFKS
jgi:hypothetical protein